MPIPVSVTSRMALSACKQEGTSISNNQTQGMTDEARVENRTVTADSNLSMEAMASSDQTYVQNAAASDLFEIETSGKRSQRR